ncbi:DUF1642 domain-containing protein [Streptococcus macedonicus]|uniref:DUF1642 domain-containing protein n=1 Tax=Streptococcus macedonicus TaxID=59310 RepID=UPI0015D87A03|nr:DUF1642 domain-containing protein [Streptococcus macedonicus]
MNKQEATDGFRKLMEEYNNKLITTNGQILPDSDIEELVVPQFIDAWIKGAKYNGFDLYEAMTDNDMSDNVVTWIVCNSETFAKAWLFGYEVEKEKRYTVQLPNPNGDSNRYGLCKVDGRIIIGSFVFGLNKAINTKLTEAEIKKDFDWAWQFAKEVEE